MSKKIIPTAEMTPEKIAELKVLYGEVIEIQVSDDSKKLDPYMLPADEDAEFDKPLSIFLRPMNDKEFGFALNKLPAVIEAGKVVIKNTMIGGDERVVDDATLFSSAAMQAVELIEVKRTRLKKH
jgi:hypothetical protein